MPKRKKFRQLYIISAGAFFSLLICLHGARAQEVTQSIDLFIQSIPLDPEPGQTVTLEARSYSVDVSKQLLSWSYGGASIGSGVGKSRVTVVAPAAGAIATATVTLSGNNINPVSASISLRPASLDILWEAVDATVPPFYKGRPMLSLGGAARVVAIPAAGAPRQATYAWTHNGKPLAAATGSGKSSVIITSSALQQSEQVAASASGATFEGRGAATITPEPPELVAYERKEGFVDYGNGSIGTLRTPQQGITLRFEPFFFTLQSNSTKDLSFSFRSSGEGIFPDDRQNEIRLSRPEESSEIPISAEVKTTFYSLQNVSRNFRVLFE